MIETHNARLMAIVSGGTRGIGLAIARRLARKGYALELIYRGDESTARKASERLAADGAEFNLIKADLSTNIGIEHVKDSIFSRYNGIDLLVNNAGGTRDGAFQMMRPDDYIPIINSNLFGPLHLTLALSQLLIERAKTTGHSSIVMMSSMAGVTGKEGQTPYATTKGGLIGLTRLLASRFGKYGVCINAIAPGFIRTDMVNDLNPSAYEHVLRASASPRLGEPAEVAELTAFLGSPKSAYINGQTVRIDGGFLR